MSFSSSRTSAWKAWVCRVAPASGFSVVCMLARPPRGAARAGDLGSQRGIFKRRERGGERWSSGREAQQVALDTVDRPDAERRGGREQRQGTFDDLGDRGGRHVATDAGQVIDLVPEVQEDFHRSRTL